MSNEQNKTIQSILDIMNPALCDETTYKLFKQRLTEDLPTRDENPANHFCVYSLPFNSLNKKIFFVHHKKSGLWISPGGHIDKGETLTEALNREIEEELGVKKFFNKTPTPFLLTTTPIENRIQPCKMHYDVWYLVPTNGSNFNIDPKEFHDTKWLTISEAKKMVTNSVNIRALGVLSILENKKIKI